MSDLNSCTFTGRLGKDAELKMIGAKQTPCAVFSLANDTGFGQYQKTSWIEVQLWGTKATSLVEYLKKGSRVGVVGEFTQNDWVDQNGVKHSSWRLSANSITLLGGSANKQQPAVAPDEDEVVF